MLICRFRYVGRSTMSGPKKTKSAIGRGHHMRHYGSLASKPNEIFCATVISKPYFLSSVSYAVLSFTTNLFTITIGKQDPDLALLSVEMYEDPDLALFSVENTGKATIKVAVKFSRKICASQISR